MLFRSGSGSISVLGGQDGGKRVGDIAFEEMPPFDEEMAEKSSFIDIGFHNKSYKQPVESFKENPRADDKEGGFKEDFIKEPGGFDTEDIAKAFAQNLILAAKNI